MRLFVSLLTLSTLAAGASNAPRFAYGFSSSSFGTTSLVLDSSGNTYVAGSTTGNPFSATAGVIQAKNAGGTCYGGGAGDIGPPVPIPCRNAFVMKLDAFGSVVYATYLGGSVDADVTGMAVDPQGNVYLLGTLVASPGADSSVFPITPGAAFPIAAIAGSSGNAAFVAKLNSSATQLVYATVIPGMFPGAIAVNTAGEVLFTGYWSPAFGSFPATAGAYQTVPGNGTGDTVVGKLNASGSALIYGTYLSGALGTSFGYGIATDGSGSAIVSGSTTATDFPATAGQFSGTSEDAYLAKLSPDGSSLVTASLLGPGAASNLRTGADGSIHLWCWSPSLPVTNSGFGVTPGTGDYLLHVAGDLSSVLSSVFVPFQVSAFDVDAAGNVYLAGSGAVTSTAGAFLPSDGSSSGLVVAKIAADGTVAGVTDVGPSGGNPAIAAESDGSVIFSGGVATGTPGTGENFVLENFFPAVTLENDASFASGAAVAGELAAIRGYGLGPAAGIDSAPVSNLAGVQVFFDSFPAPIIYAQADQVNVQVPWEIAGQAATRVRIVYNGSEAGGATVAVAAALPGVFYVENFNGSKNSPANPARPGEIVSIYGTGGGLMHPPGMTGGYWPLSGLSNLALPVSAALGGEAAEVLYAGSAPTHVSGFFQINLQVPENAQAGTQNLVVSIGGNAGVPAVISVGQ